MTDVTLEEIMTTAEFLKSKGDVLRTPLIGGIEKCVEKLRNHQNLKIHFKMESLQTTGSFKYRGATNQVCQRAQTLKDGQQLVCYSGGNYGKAFASVAGKLGIPAVVLMPNTVPPDRIPLLEGLGAKVEVHKYTDIPIKIKEYKEKLGMSYLDPFDDLDLIRGYGSVALEILEELPTADIVLVPCGGGGLLSGVAATFRLSGHMNTRIYGVEPVTACTMKKSFDIGDVAEMPDAHSIATGLVPIRSGDITYPMSKKYVNDILLVTDAEIIEATRVIRQELQMVVEPSGTAGLAAILAEKIPEDLDGKEVVIIISGSNISLADLDKLLKNS